MFAEPSAATVALEGMNGYELLGNNLRVSLAAHSGTFGDSGMGGVSNVTDIYSY